MSIKKIFFNTVTLLLFLEIANAQVIENIQDKSLIEKSYNLCTYYILYFELKELNLTDYIFKFNQRFKINNSVVPSKEDFVSFIKENDTLKYLKVLFSSIEEIRKKIEKDTFPNENVFIVNLINFVFSNNLKDFKINKTPENIFNIKAAIQNELKEMFLIYKIQSKTNSNYSEAKLNDEPRNESHFSKFLIENLTYFLIIFGILYIAIFIVIYRLNNRLKFLSVNNSKDQKKEILRIENEIKKINESLNNFVKMNELLGKIEILKNDLSEKIYEQVIEQLQKISVVVNIPEEKTFTLYFPYPDKERGFDINKKSTIFEPTESIYEINFVNENFGRFKICNHETVVNRVVQLTHIYLEPACEELNDFNPNAKGIVTIEEGEVEKEGDYYKIIKKAKIKYD